MMMMRRSEREQLALTSLAALYMYRLTIRIRSDDTLRPNTNTLFGPLFGTEANIRYIPNVYYSNLC